MSASLYNSTPYFKLLWEYRLPFGVPHSRDPWLLSLNRWLWISTYFAFFFAPTFVNERLVHECMWDRIKCSRVINVCNHTLFCLLSFLMCLFHRFLCSFVGFCFLNSFALSSNSFFVSFDITLPFFCTHFFSDTMFLLFCTLYTHFVNLLYYLCPQILDGRSIVCVIHDGSNNSLSLLLRFLLAYQSVIFGDFIA